LTIPRRRFAAALASAKPSLVDVVDVAVVGGGVAGLSVAAALARDARVLLLEREALLASHASGRNAAIFRPLEHDRSTASLARRSLQLMAVWSERPLLSRTGLVLASAAREPARALFDHGRAQGVACDWLEGDALAQHASSLEGGEVACGVLVPDGGVLDIHALTTALADVARARGARLQSGCGVHRIEVEGARITGVALDSGERIACAATVLAAGAWSAQLAAACGAPLPLAPVRRHLVQLDLHTALPPQHPVVWRVDDEIYFRPESGGVLASPCDQHVWQPEDPPADRGVLESLATKLARTAPSLAGARVRRFWACLRTFAPDRELVAGADPRIAGLHWFTGLGGRGMGVGPAAGELVAAVVRGEKHAMPELAPGRFAC
jgi:D-arginine dehydrogenase